MSDSTLSLWSTPIGVHEFAQAERLNPLLSRVLGAMRVTDPDNDPEAAFYASRDDLLNRIQIPEWRDFLQFVVESVRDTAKTANAGVWPEQSVDLQIALRGIWFQVSNHGVHHDVHTHGNCSWSGVYVVDVDEDTDRRSHSVYGERNGITRFYGPHFSHLAGASMDFGNAYLQAATADFDPQPGRLIVFPSWLPHQAMPYAGERDRLIISFNASVHRADGGDGIAGYVN